MAIVDCIPAWLAASPPAASELFPRQGEVSPKATEWAPAFSPAASTDSPSSSSSPPDSPFATPHSPQFPGCEGLSDTLLAEIAAGTQALAAIAAHHHIPYPRFTLWLLQPSTQDSPPSPSPSPPRPASPPPPRSPTSSAA